MAFPSSFGSGDSKATTYTLLNAFLAATKLILGAQAPSEVTIASGQITPTGPAHSVDTEGSAATDNLDLIDTSNLADGSLLLLYAEDVSRVVTVRHLQGGSGQIHMANSAAFSLSSAGDALVLQRRGTDWYEVLRNGPSVFSLIDGMTAANARTALGLAIGSDVLAYNSHVIFDNVAVTLTKAQRQAITTVTDQATIAPDLNASNHLVWELGADRTMPEFTPTAPGLWWWDVSGDYDLTFDAAYEVYGDAYDGSGTNSNVVILTYDGTTKRIYVMSVTEAA